MKVMLIVEPIPALSISVTERSEGMDPAGNLRSTLFSNFNRFAGLILKMLFNENKVKEKSN